MQHSRRREDFCQYSPKDKLILRGGVGWGGDLIFSNMLSFCSNFFTFSDFIMLLVVLLHGFQSAFVEHHQRYLPRRWC